MNIGEIIFFVLFSIIGLLLLYTGWSVLSYNSQIIEIQGTIKEQVPLSATGSRCLVLPDGSDICNYVVGYNLSGDQKTAIVGSFSSRKIGENLQLYVDSVNKTVSTVPPVISNEMGWFYIILGILNFAFIVYYIYMTNKQRCAMNTIETTKYYIY